MITWLLEAMLALAACASVIGAIVGCGVSAALMLDTLVRWVKR